MLIPRHVEELRNPSELIGSLLAEGIVVAFEAHGTSMLPTILPGDKLTVEPATAVRRGDVILCRLQRGLTAHRVVAITGSGDDAMTTCRGDNAATDDPPVRRADVLGRVVAVTRDGARVSVDRRHAGARLLAQMKRRMRAYFSRLRRS